MEIKIVIVVLVVLVQDFCLVIFCFFVQVGLEGSVVSKIGEVLDIVFLFLFFYMKEFLYVGLVILYQEGCFVIYVVNYIVMNDVLGFFIENCCGGNVCLLVMVCCELIVIVE